MLLAIYLNDHLAGATLGRELAHRTARNNRSTSYGDALTRLAGEIDEDRQSLLRVMAALKIRRDPVKVAAAWGAEKLGRLKLNGRIRGYSPLSRLVELEALALGVTGKLALWRTVDQMQFPAIHDIDLAELQRRAEDQQGRLETCRLRAASDALAS